MQVLLTATEYVTPNADAALFTDKAQDWWIIRISDTHFFNVVPGEQIILRKSMDDYVLDNDSDQVVIGDYDWMLCENEADAMNTLFDYMDRTGQWQ